MKIFVTLLIVAAVTVAIVEAQAHTRSRPSSGHGKIQRSSVRTAPRNPPKNVPSSKHRSKAGGTSIHIKTHNQRNNKPRIPNSTRTNKGNTKVKPAPKSVATKPAQIPQMKKEKVKLSIGHPKNNKPANIVKPTVTSQAKKDADKTKVTNVPKNIASHTKNNNIKPIPNVKINGDVKPAIKNLLEKPLISTAQAKNKIVKKTNNDIPVNVGSKQQVNKESETVKDKKVQGTVNIEMKNKKPVLNVAVEKKFFDSKDTSVLLKGDATLQGGVAPTVSLGIDATKNGNSGNAQLKVAGGKSALNTKFRKDFLNGQDASFALEVGANLQKGKKSEYSLGMEGAKGGHSVSATAKVVDGKPALDTQIRSEFLNGKDGSFAVKTGANLQKGEKPEYFFGMEGAKGGHSVSATSKLVDGKPALDTQLRSEFLNGKDGSFALKAGVNLQKGEKPEYFYGIEGTKNGNSINAGAKIVNGKPEFGLGITIPF